MIKILKSLKFVIINEKATVELSFHRVYLHLSPMSGILYFIGLE